MYYLSVKPMHYIAHNKIQLNIIFVINHSLSPYCGGKTQYGKNTALPFIGASYYIYIGSNIFKL